jgi:hypothetical protein
MAQLRAASRDRRLGAEMPGDATESPSETTGEGVGFCSVVAERTAIMFGFRSRQT